MGKILRIALKLRLRQKFWGKMLFKWHRKQINNLVNGINIDTKDFKILK